MFRAHARLLIVALVLIGGVALAGTAGTGGTVKLIEFRNGAGEFERIETSPLVRARFDGEVRPLLIGARLPVEAVIRTDEARAFVALDDGAELAIGPGSEVGLAGLSLTAGGLYLSVKSSRIVTVGKIEVRTRGAVVEVLGPDPVQVAVRMGAVTVRVQGIDFEVQAREHFEVTQAGTFSEVGKWEKCAVCGGRHGLLDPFNH